MGKYKRAFNRKSVNRTTVFAIYAYLYTNINMCLGILIIDYNVVQYMFYGNITYSRVQLNLQPDQTFTIEFQ